MEKRGQRRVWSQASLLKHRIKASRGRKEGFFLHVKGKKMDLFVWLLGCLLAFLCSSGVKGEEGGKFDTFLPAQVLTINRPFSRSSESGSLQIDLNEEKSDFFNQPTMHKM